MVSGERHRVTHGLEINSADIISSTVIEMEAGGGRGARATEG
jgi:hypothetical protein